MLPSVNLKRWLGKRLRLPGLPNLNLKLEQFRLPSPISYVKIGTGIFNTSYYRHTNVTVTLRKHITKYKDMLKFMIEFLRKFESRGDKIVRVN